MITKMISCGQATWQKILGNVIVDPQELLALLKLSPADIALPSAALDFKLRVPRGFVARMQPGNPKDPVLLQVLPTQAERLLMPGFYNDPLKEHSFTPTPGLIHKYQGRVLLTVTGACGIHCRYCFRQHFPYQDHLLTPQRLTAIIDYLANDTSINEVILSGGDPLTIIDEKLVALVNALETLPHVQRLRIHSRLPVVVPERITEALVYLLTHTRLYTVIVMHVNHAQEINADVINALKLLRDAGVVLLNQAVLLHGINDTVEALVNLSEAVFKAGMLPYYLHMLDKVQGAAHFEVPETKAQHLMRELLAQLPGYLVPKLVRELPGHASKVPVEILLAKEE